MVSTYIVWETRQLGVPRWMLARMMLNVAIDTAIGSVPVFGDVFDVMVRTNLKNMALLKRYLERQTRTAAGTIIDGSFSLSCRRAGLSSAEPMAGCLRSL